MTAAELEKLLAEVTQGEWVWRWKSESLHAKSDDREFGDVILQPQYDYDTGASLGVSEANASLIAMAPALARRAIAAERIAEALRQYKARATRVPFDLAMSSDAALAAYEAAK